jgi:hypothetical protein
MTSGTASRARDRARVFASEKSKKKGETLSSLSLFLQTKEVISSF